MNAHDIIHNQIYLKDVKTGPLLLVRLEPYAFRCRHDAAVKQTSSGLLAECFTGTSIADIEKRNTIFPHWFGLKDIGEVENVFKNPLKSSCLIPRIDMHYPVTLDSKHFLTNSLTELDRGLWFIKNFLNKHYEASKDVEDIDAYNPSNFPEAHIKYIRERSETEKFIRLREAFLKDTYNIGEEDANIISSIIGTSKL